MMLQGDVRRDNKVVYSSVVLNDIVIHRGDELAITDYDVFVNGDKCSLKSHVLFLTAYPYNCL